MIFCLALIGCDPANPPVIVNGYSEPVEISISFTNDIPAIIGIKLPPNKELVQRRKGLELATITVKESSGALHVYDFAKIKQIRSNQNIDFEVWIISKDGIRLCNKSDLQKLQETARNKP